MGEEGGTTGGGGYMAAVHAAAAAAARERMLGAAPARPGGETSPVRDKAAPPPKSERERVKERLHALYEGGLVVTAPFLQATQAQPLSLLAPSGDEVWQERGAEAAGAESAEPSSIDGIDADAYNVLLGLVQQSIAASMHVSKMGPAMARVSTLPAHVTAQ